MLEVQRLLNEIEAHPLDPDRGLPLVQVKGLSSVFVEEVVGILNGVGAKLGAFGVIYSTRSDVAEPEDDES